MKVEEFGVGFPPRLFSIRRRGVRYSINWIPIGGFVKIKGETGDDRNDPNAFVSKSASRRLLVLSAGVLMNLLLAMVLLGAGSAFGLPQVVDESLPSNARVKEVQVQVYTVVDPSPAEEAGIQTGDAIVQIDDVIVTSAELAQTYIAEHGEQSLTLRVKRGADFFTYTVTPAALSETEGRKALGVGMVTIGTVSYPWYLAAVKGIEGTFVLGSQMVVGLFDLVKGLIVEQRVSVDLSGPVGIAVLTGQVAEQGFASLILFTALLSINLAIINFLPFPALDGGRALFVVIEKLRGKPISAKTENLAHNIGFGLLMLLIIAVTYKDIVGLILH